MLFVFSTTCSEEEICYRISSEIIDTVIWSQPLPFSSHFRSYAIFQFFLGKSKIRRIFVHFQLFELVYIKELGGKVVVKLQHSQFCVLKNEEYDNDWFFVFDLCFDELSFLKLFVHFIELFEQFTINGRMCFFVSEVLRYSVSAPVQNLVTLGAIG